MIARKELNKFCFLVKSHLGDIVVLKEDRPPYFFNSLSVDLMDKGILKIEIRYANAEYRNVAFTEFYLFPYRAYERVLSTINQI